MQEKASLSINVYVDPDLADLVPTFLENRGKDLDKLRAAMAGGDYRAIQHIGHSMKGVGGGYGFDRITELGKMIESAAANTDEAGVVEGMEQLADFLQCVVVVYR